MYFDRLINFSSISETSTSFTELNPRPSMSKGDSGEKWLPKYVIYDRLNLRFNGYYLDESTESSNRRRAIRPINLSYFLEDDTISVHEPVTPVSNYFVYETSRSLL